VVRLALKSVPSTGLYLVSSTADVHFEKLEAGRLDFYTTDLKPVILVIGGGGSRKKIKTRINDNFAEMMTDDTGHLCLTLPMESHTILEAIP
jgi:hypothetical protein